MKFLLFTDKNNHYQAALRSSKTQHRQRDCVGAERRVPLPLLRLTPPSFIVLSFFWVHQVTLLALPLRSPPSDPHTLTHINAGDCTFAHLRKNTIAT